MKRAILCLVFLLIFQAHNAEARIHKITAYCACVKCCGIWKDGRLISDKYCDGITASGKKARPGMVACNYLDFGSRILISGLGMFTVQDRGSRKYFGSKQRRKYAIDIYMDNHDDAKQFGVKHLDVILK